MNETELKRAIEKIEGEIKMLDIRVKKIEIDTALSANDYKYIIEKQDKSMDMLEGLIDKVNLIEQKPLKRYELIITTVITGVVGMVVGMMMNGIIP